MRNVQTYDFGSLNNLGTPLLKWEMEKQRVFDSLNNLELEALELYKTLELRLSATTPLSLPHQQELLMKPIYSTFDLIFFAFFVEGNYLMVTRCQAMLALLTYTHCLSGLIQILAAFGYISARAVVLVYFQVSGISSWQHCMKIKC